MDDKLIFLEIGASYKPDLLFLLGPKKWWAHPTVRQHPYFYVRFGTKTKWFGIFVEPHPQNLILMNKDLKHTGISETDYKIYSGVVGGETKFVEFHTASMSVEDVHSQIKTDQSFYAVSKTEHKREGGDCLFYQTMTLDALLSDIASPVSLLSIDVEGAELEILSNFSFSQKPQIIMECHLNDTHHTSEKAIEILEAQDYTVFPKIKQALRHPHTTLFAISPEYEKIARDKE